MPKDFHSLLPQKFIRLLEHKLETNEITREECKVILKEFLLREFDRKKSGQSQSAWKALAIKLQNRSQSILNKLWSRSFAEPTIGMEELAGTVRARRI